MDNISRYSMKLDAIDINYLPVAFSRHYNSVAPLWSVGLDRNEYFEFEIRDKKEETNKECIQTTTCYICNIEVPKLFLKDHQESKKHYINKCIAEIALDRMKIHLQNNENVDIMDDVPCDTYFCSECITIVLFKDQKSHENLQSHKHSVYIDKMFEDFYNIYANNYPLKNKKDDKHELNTNFNKSDSVQCTSDHISLISNLIEVGKCKESEINNKIPLIKYTAQDLKKMDSGRNLSDTAIVKLISDKSEFVFKDIDQVASRSTDSNNIEVPTSSNLMIALDKDTPPKNVDMTCLSQLDDGNYHCNICYSTFDGNCLNSHVLGARHKMNNISNLHYMMKESGTDLFCTVCSNTLENSVKSVKQHCKGANHTAKYKKLLSDNDIIKIGTGFHCETCDKNIPKRNELIHIYNYRLHKKVKIENTYCSDCDIFVPHMEIHKHENSLQHLERIIDSNKICQPYFCQICQVNVPNSKQNILIHINGAPHKKKSQQLVYNDAEPTPSPSPQKIHETSKLIIPDSKTIEIKNIVCEVCQVQIPNTDKNITEHEMGRVHVKNFAALLIREDIVIIDSGYYCEICNINIKKPLKHVKTKHHKQLMTQKNTDQMEVINNIKQLDVDTPKHGHIETISDSVIQHFEDRGTTAIKQIYVDQDIVTISDTRLLTERQNFVSDQSPSSSIKFIASDPNPSTSNYEVTVSDQNLRSTDSLICLPF